MTIITILVWLLIAVAIIVAAALVLPFGIKFEAVLGGLPHGRVKVQPFGESGPWLAVWETGQARPSRKRDKPVSRRKSARPAMPLVKAGYRLFADVLALVRLRAFVVDVKFGCEDPADTGQIYGAITPFIYGARGLRRSYVHVEPVFGLRVFEGRAVVDMAIVPIALLPTLLRFGWNLVRGAR